MIAEPLPIARLSSGPAEGVVTLTLRQPGRAVVVLDWALLRAIDAALDEVARLRPRGFVLASEGRVFVAGANLKEIMELSDARLHEYLEFGSRVFGKISALACTSVAAINGAVLGGGLEIAMHCDRLLGAEPAPGTPDKPARPYQVGLPEAGLSICPGWGGTSMLPARMMGVPGGCERAIEMTATGRPFDALAARDAGLFEALVPAGELLERAQRLAAQPRARRAGDPVCIAERQRVEDVGGALERVRARLPDTGAARAVVACVEVGLNEGWAAALGAERERLVHLRSTPEGQAAIAAFFAKSGSSQ